MANATETQNTQLTEDSDAYTHGILKEIYGDYADREKEYRFASEIALKHALLRVDTPVLDIGCRNPYLGMLRFLREWRWEGKYVGIDKDVPADVAQTAKHDAFANVHQMDLDGKRLPFPPTVEDPTKLFAVAFIIETLEHFKNRALLLNEAQRVAGSVVVIAPNKEFTGYYPDNPFHQRAVSVEELKDFGFQMSGYVNFNGRASKDSDTVFPMRNGECETSSEVWGVWVDQIAIERGFMKQRPKRTYELKVVTDENGKISMQEVGDMGAKPNITFVDRQTGR